MGIVLKLIRIFHLCCYDQGWYFGIVNYVSIEKLDKIVTFPHSKGPTAKFNQI